MSDEVKREKITEFVAGQNVFTSNGVSSVKVTRDGEITCLDIPIQSTGIAELIDTFKEKAPTPPRKQQMVDPDSEVGKGMGLTKKNGVWMYDLTDPDYIKAKEEHNSNLGIAVLLKGLAVAIKNAEGVLVEDRAEKIKILKSMGMSGDQFQQIINDIQNLTCWSEEEKTHFLG